MQVPPGVVRQWRSARAQAARRNVPGLRQAAAAAGGALRGVHRLLGLPRLQVHQARRCADRGQADRREVPVVRGGAPRGADRTLWAVCRLLALPGVQVPRQHRQGRQGARGSEAAGRALSGLWQAAGRAARPLRAVQVLLRLPQVPRPERRQESRATTFRRPVTFHRRQRLTPPLRLHGAKEALGGGSSSASWWCC